MSAVAAVFPLSQAFLPGEFVSLRVFEPRYLRMIDDLRGGSIDLCTVLIERGQEVGGGETRMSHGVMLPIEHIEVRDEGTFIGCRGGSLVSVVDWFDDSPYPTATVVRQTVEAVTDDMVATVAARMIQMMNDCRALVETLNVSAETKSLADTVTSTVRDNLGVTRGRQETEELLWRALWLTTRMIPCGPLDRYELLMPGSLSDRLDRLEEIIGHVREIVRFRSET